MAGSVSDTLLQQAGVSGDPLAAANAMAARGEMDAAQKLLEDLVKRSPRRADAWFGLGQVHAQRNAFKPAAQAFKRAIQLIPHIPDGYVLLGNLYLRNGRTSQALDTYRDGLKHQPRNPLLHFNLGIGLRQSGDLEGAIASYKKAIELQPSYAQAYFSLGNAYRDLNRLEDAEAAYRQAIALEPNHADAYTNLGALLASKEDHLAAIEVSLAALERAPSHIHALRNLTLSLNKLGRFAEGAGVAISALAVAPDDTALNYHTSELLYGLIRAGELAKAQEFARQWRQVSPNHPVAQHMTAAILGEGMPKRAGDHYVRETFDRFSQDFDETLERLNYRIPETLSNAALEAIGRRDIAILDAGCGTGLCAPYLKPAARKLTGVDLSGGMLARARERGLYDALHEAELNTFLAQTPDRYDLTIAADVFCYFGALAPSFVAIADKTAPQGIFGFTVEAMQGGAPVEGYRLGAAGRYQHDEAYVRSSLEDAGFNILRLEVVPGRLEMGKPVDFFMALAQKA